MAAALPAAPALAHIVAPGTPLSYVLSHPAFDLPHALPLIALGLWAGRQPGGVRWTTLGALLAGVAGGVALARLELLPPWRSGAVFASMIVLGGLVALDQRLPGWACAALAGAAGVYQGVLGVLPPFMGGRGTHPVQDLFVAALLLPLLASELVVRLRAGWTHIAVRVLGSWIAAAGILLMAFAVRLRTGIGG